MGLTAGDKVQRSLPTYPTTSLRPCYVTCSRRSPRPSCMVVTGARGSGAAHHRRARRAEPAGGQRGVVAAFDRGTHSGGRLLPRRPRVDSAVLRIDLADRPTVDADGTWSGFSPSRARVSPPGESSFTTSRDPGCGCRRAGRFGSSPRGIDPTRRAQTLSLEEWARLCRELRGGVRGSFSSGPTGFALAMMMTRWLLLYGQAETSASRWSAASAASQDWPAASPRRCTCSGTLMSVCSTA